jgi:hypothetical protein
MKKITFALMAFTLTGQLLAQNPSRRPVDDDGDGKISRKEFPGPNELFERFDANRDGFIDEKEREAMRGARRQGGRGGFGGGQGQGMPLREFFHTLDADSNRQISKKEWGLLCKASDFKKADTDKNNQVAPMELFRFLGMGQGDRPGGGGRERPDRGPAVGSPAPKVVAKTMADEKPIDLSKVTRATVLVFGSYT